MEHELLDLAFVRQQAIQDDEATVASFQAQRAEERRAKRDNLDGDKAVIAVRTGKLAWPPRPTWPEPSASRKRLVLEAEISKESVKRRGLREAARGRAVCVAGGWRGAFCRERSGSP